MIGDFEITLDSAELLGPEYEGEETELDTYILLKLTVKNIGAEPEDLGDFMDTMIVTEYMDQSEEMNEAFMLKSLDQLDGMLEPNEVISGDFLASMFEADTYHFSRGQGTIAGGAGNQVIWTINEEDLD